MNLTLSQSLGLQTKQYLDEARQRQNPLAFHFAGRFRLLGTATVGAVEVVVRLALFLLGQIAGVFCLYQSADINRFLMEQTRAGFSAALISSAGFFSLLAPDLFRGISIPVTGLNPAQPLEREPTRPVRYRALESAIEERVTRLILDVVTLPFKMVAFFFELPFYCIYFAFQISFVLPMRLMLLPFQIFIDALSFQRPRINFELI